MDIQRETAEEKALFQRLREGYIESIPLKLAELTSAWDQVRKKNWHADQVTVLKRQVHRLAGSGSSYGLPEITQAARKLEKVLGPEQKKAEAGKTSLAPACAAEFRELREVLVVLIDSNSNPRRV